MTLQLTDNLWSLKLDTTLDATVARHLMGTFTSSFIVVNISPAVEIDSRWRKAGSFGQAIALNDELAYGEVKDIILDTYLLLEFPLLTEDDYQLYYFPLPRLVEVAIQVWEYKGIVKDAEISKLLDALQDFQFSRLENKLDRLLGCCNCNDGDTLPVKKKRNRPYLLYYHHLL